MGNRIEIGLEATKIALQKMNPIKVVRDAIIEARVASFDRKVERLTREGFESLPPDSQLKIALSFGEFNARSAAKVHRELAQGHIKEASELDGEAAQLGNELVSHGWNRLTS